VKKTTLTVTLAAMFALLAGAAFAKDGDTKKKDADPAKKADAKPAPSLPADALTHETLKTRLEDMGYDFKVTKSTNGTPMYLVTIDRNNYRFVFYASLSSDFKRLWVSSALRPLPEAGKVRADILEKLLAKNYDIGPIHFAVKSNRYLYLDLALMNRHITARSLRTDLDEFMAAVRSTETLWNPEKYPAPVPAVAKNDKDAK
jgi:hypothetical protein